MYLAEAAISISSRNWFSVRFEFNFWASASSVPAACQNEWRLLENPGGRDGKNSIWCEQSNRTDFYRVFFFRSTFYELILIADYKLIRNEIDMRSRRKKNTAHCPEVCFAKMASYEKLKSNLVLCKVMDVNRATLWYPKPAQPLQSMSSADSQPFHLLLIQFHVVSCHVFSRSFVGYVYCCALCLALAVQMPIHFPTIVNSKLVWFLFYFV